MPLFRIRTMLPASRLASHEEGPLRFKHFMRTCPDTKEFTYEVIAEYWHSIPDLQVAGMASIKKTFPVTISEINYI